MTVIVYRDGVMAADGATWQGDIIVDQRSRKIIRMPDGRLIGCCGKRPDIEAFIQWQVGGALPDRVPDVTHITEGDFGAIIAKPDGAFDKVDSRFRAYRASGAWAVEGCHGEFLHGALAMGATAEQAVRLAVKYGMMAAGAVQVERVGQIAAVA